MWTQASVTRTVANHMLDSQSEMDTAPSSSGIFDERLVSCCLLVPRFMAHGAQRLRVTGNIRQLGAWERALDLLPNDQDENMYSANVHLPLGEKIEAKVS